MRKIWQNFLPSYIWLNATEPAVDKGCMRIMKKMIFGKRIRNAEIRCCIEFQNG